MKRIVVHLFTVVFFAATLCHADPPKNSNALQANRLKVGNLTREFYYYAPSGLTKAPKLVFVLHKSGMPANRMPMLSGHQFERLAEKYGDMVIAYPQGYDRCWNDCRKGETSEAKKLRIDDVAFFEGMIEYFKDKFGIDASSVFATGFSNGAQMCLKLAKERPGLFRGIASVGANLPGDGNDDCTETKLPVSILLMNGTSDPINPYNGGLVKAGDGKQRGEVLSTSRTLQYWLELDKGDSTSVKEYAYPDLDKRDKSTAIKYTYDCARTGKRVVLIKVINGGHIFMNDGFGYWPRAWGNVNKDISAPAVILEFFRSLS